MTTKAKALALTGPPAAGIFSDMTVDGPEIGTLVVVVDRAKNLPNRKTIGKQDPYCAARLGKEAKKTTTDIRGGQTPKWDQELRFTVHDSPDYYQIKVSVFNDDKRTELIGEAWIDLRTIVVPGGGQSDQWHQLNYKGKYAGELRLEITYYDSRPKPEKPVVKAKPQPQETQDAPAPPPPGPIAGPRGVPKRRPLPSDPLTGKSPAAPAVPDQADTTSSRPPPNPAPVQAPPPGQYAAPVQQGSPAQYTPPVHPPPPPTHYSAPVQQPPPGQYPAPVQQPPPAQYSQPIQQPSPQPEYGHPSSQAPPPAQYYSSPDPGRDVGLPVPAQYRTPDRVDPYAVQQEPVYTGIYQPPRRNSFDPSQPNGSRSFDFEEDRPPPPPAHRTRTGSSPAMGNSFQGPPANMRQDVLRNEAHRNSFDSGNSYPGRPTYKAAYDSAPLPALPGPQYSHPDQVRHPSYDPGYESHHRTMQATVEDVPESPESMNDPRRASMNRWPAPTPFPPQPSQFEQAYDSSANPAPLTLPSRSNTEVSRYTPDARYQGANGHSPGPEFPHRESADYAPQYGRHSEPALQTPQPDQMALTYRSELDDTSRPSVPPVPPSLVPGIDPSIAQEISERINQDRRQQQMVQQQPVQQNRGYSSQALVETPSRGRPVEPRYVQDPPPATYSASSSRGNITYTPGPSTSSVNVVIKKRAYSPNPPRDPSPNPRSQHTIRRKSVSPHPGVDSERSMSMPFSPDSYEVLNPNAAVVAKQDTPAARDDYREDTGKIITHDGREVDPSDHLPMESWAPEPEPKPQQQQSTSPSRPAPSGRRQLRVAGRPQSMQPVTSGVSFSSGNDPVQNANHPSSAARNRLQKKPAYRQSTSAIVPVMSGANGAGMSPGSAPRPTSSGADDDHFTPTRLSRASTFDYAAGVSSGGDGYGHGGGSRGGGADIYGTSPGSLRYGHTPPGHGHGQHHSYGTSPSQSYSGYHQQSRSPGGGGNINGHNNPPPLPAKVPLALPPPSSSSENLNGNMSGALQLHSSSVARRQGQGMDDYDDYVYSSQNGGGGGGQLTSLEEELRQIDIGTGRSSRKNAQQAAHQYGGQQQGYGSVGYGHGREGGYGGGGYGGGY